MIIFVQIIRIYNLTICLEIHTPASKVIFSGDRELGQGFAELGFGFTRADYRGREGQ